MSIFTRAYFGDDDTFGRRLKIERLRTGRTVAEAAKFAEVSKQSWGCWERDIGAQHITVQALRLMSMGGMDAQYIVTGSRAPRMGNVWSALIHLNVKEQLGELDQPDRRRFLLELLREEFNA